jgi:6-phosphofructokinase 1
MPRNVVAPKRRPDPVINNSLRGVLEACLDRPDLFVKISPACTASKACSRRNARSLRPAHRGDRPAAHYPAAGTIGTCRYKLKAKQAEDFAA